MMNLRCSSQAGDSGRYQCQLLVGHESEHAAMVCIGGTRRILSWRRPGEASRCLAAEAAPGYPWAPSFPVVEASVNDMPVAATRPARRPAAETTTVPRLAG